MILKAVKKLRNTIWNFVIMVIGLFIRRDNKVILMGAWMGTKFADNPRYLYQYLFQEKEKLNLKKIIWVTRSKEVNGMLNEMGYESYLCGTMESNYWHLKAGVHIICNGASKNAGLGLKQDIDSQYSWGAKKINLWHGVGMKSVGTAANSYKSETLFGNKKKKNRLINKYMSLGGWGDAYFLSTSITNLKINQHISEVTDDKFFISIYPRNCECLRYLNKERNVIKTIKKYKGTVLYLPTFRSDYSQYCHPLSVNKVQSFLKERNFLWIEKPHTASHFVYDFDKKIENTLFLDAEFDINVLYDYVSVVVSDYSSAVFDGIYKNIPMIMYVPDLDIFKNGDIGFLFDIEEYCKGLISYKLDDVLVQLNKIYEGQYFTPEIQSTFQFIRKEFFGARESSYKQIWEDICALK